MTFRKKTFTPWQDTSITTKHSAGFGLLVFLMVIIASTGILSLYLVQKADDAIKINTEIQRLIFEMDRDMETARYLHAGFFIYYPKIGLQKAHEGYAQPSVRKTAKVVSTSHTLREMINHPRVSHAFRESKIDLNLYLSSAKRFADTSIESFELATRLAAPVNGLEDMMDQQIRELKTATARNGQLSLAVRDMEALISHYRIKRKRHFMQSAFNVIFSLRGRIKALIPDPRQKDTVNSILDQIRATADQILSIDVAIDSKFKDFMLQENAANRVSEKLIALANSEVDQAQQEISMTQSLAPAILFGVTLLGLVAAGIIAYLFNINITQRIVRLTHVTKKIKKGHLDVVAEEDSLDELGHLGKTFNFMAARMKGLVDNLEQEVRDRTLELRQANQSLQAEIRDRKRAEETIKQKEAFLNRVIDQSPFATWISDAHGTLERANRVLKRFLNVTDEQIVGKYNVLSDPLIAKQNLLPLIRTVFEKGQTVHFTCSWDGRDIPAMDLKGSNAVTIDATMFPILNPKGEVTNVVLNWIDITEKKRMETEKQALEQQLRQSHKMEAIGTLTGGVAHDFNNLLGIMLGNAELALSDAPQGSPARESLEEIKTAGLRAKEVIRQLLSYSRKTEQHQTAQNLGRLTKDSIKLLRSSIPARVQIVQEIAEETLMVLADATQIHQVILNLSTNAAHAMEESGGILGIHVSSLCLEEWKGGRYEKLCPGTYVELRITDTGSGISPDVLDKIFDPYYTTKAFGKGTGMGLAVVHGIVKSHRAVIHVESRPAHGTSFSIFFKRLQTYEEETIQVPPEAPLKGTERILFVDDEQAIAEMMSRMIKKLGYQVVSVTSPTDAIEKFKADPDGFDLVITDYTMPRMDGAQLSETLKQVRPDLPIIICTGHSATLSDQQARDMGISAYAMKPVSMREIAAKIRDVLGSAAPSP